MVKAFDGSLYISVGEKIYAADKIEEHQKCSKEFDSTQPTTKKRSQYIPPANHPWRRFTFGNFKNKTQHRTSA